MGSSGINRVHGDNHRDCLWGDQRLLRNSEEETIFEEMSSRRSLFLLTAVCPLLLGKPQYGAAPPVQTPETAPFVQTVSTVRSRSLTQRQSAVASKRQIVSLV